MPSVQVGVDPSTAAAAAAALLRGCCGSLPTGEFPAPAPVSPMPCISLSEARIALPDRSTTCVAPPPLPCPPLAGAPVRPAASHLVQHQRRAPPGQLHQPTLLHLRHPNRVSAVGWCRCCCTMVGGWVGVGQPHRPALLHLRHPRQVGAVGLLLLLHYGGERLGGGQDCGLGGRGAHLQGWRLAMAMPCGWPRPGPSAHIPHGPPAPSRCPPRCRAVAAARPAAAPPRSPP